MAGGSADGAEAPRICCRYCGKGAVSRVVKCKNCDNVWHRSCCDRNHLEVAVDNTTDCCSNSIAKSRPMTPILIHKNVDAAAQPSETEDPPNKALESDEDVDVKIVVIENEYLKQLLLERQRIIDDKNVIIADKSAIIALLQKRLHDLELSNSNVRAKCPRTFDDPNRCPQIPPESQRVDHLEVTDGPDRDPAVTPNATSPDNGSICKHGDDQIADDLSRSKDSIYDETGRDDVRQDLRDDSRRLAGASAASSSGGLNPTSPSAQGNVNTRGRKRVNKQDVKRNSADERVFKPKISSPPVIGNKVGDFALKSVPKLHFIHVSRLSPGTGPEDVRSFVQLTCAVHSCEALQTRYPSSYSSFKVGVSAADVDKLLDASCWPRGVLVRRFFRPRAARNSQTTF